MAYSVLGEAEPRLIIAFTIRAENSKGVARVAFEWNA